MTTLIGPFEQAITFKSAPISGPLQQTDLGLIEHAGILCADGKILKVGSFDDLQDEGDEHIETKGKQVVVPGFVDCHTHMLWGGTRAGDFERRNSGYSYQQILDEGGGIHDSVSKTRSATDDELIDGLSRRLLRHLADGVTTVEVKTGYGLSPEHELRFLRLIQEVGLYCKPDVISTFLGAHVCPAEYEKKAYLDHLIDGVFPVIKADNLTKRVDAFVEEEAFPVEIIKQYLQRAQKDGFDLTLHAGQFSPGGVSLAVALGAKSADHLESIGNHEVELLAKSKTVAVALPGASIGLGMAFTPARQLLDAGASLAIATDWNPGSAPMGDLLVQASVLATYEKLSGAEVLGGITFRAANALGLSDRGRLSSGQLADLAIFDTADYREILYHQGRLKPAQVYKRGKHVSNS
ncbi:MAG: imidazolonepropionase [Cyclobacteriaceae bacterium]